MGTPYSDRNRAPHSVQPTPPRMFASGARLRIEELGLDIEAAAGVTRVRFRAAAPADALDGLAPAER